MLPFLRLVGLYPLSPLPRLGVTALRHLLTWLQIPLFLMTSPSKLLPKTLCIMWTVMLGLFRRSPGCPLR